MGSHTTVKVFCDDFTCASGHPLGSQQSHYSGTFQTKDLEGEKGIEDEVCLVREEDRIFLYSVEEDLAEKVVKDDFHGHLLRYDRKLQLLKVSATVEFYGHCSICEPVYTRDEFGYSDDKITLQRPWVSIQMKVKNGVVVKFRRGGEDQDREKLRVQLVRGGSAVLADDDPSVVAYKNKKQGQPAEDWE